MMLIEDVQSGTPTRRRRYLVWALLVAAVVAALIAGPISDWYVNHPHGNPDPGGKRLAQLAKVARAAVPSDAGSTQLVLKKSTWDSGGCDGGPPGWTPMEAIQRFRASGNVAVEVDAKMRQMHWRVVSRFRTTYTGRFPPPTVPGANAPYVREYEPSAASGAPVAWLYTPAETGGPLWELDLEASPAEVPDHAC